MATEDASAPGLSRRQMLAASTWSVPVITVSAAAPAMAVSPPPGFLTIEPSACQYADGGLALLLHVNNPSSSPLTRVDVDRLFFNTSQRAFRGVQVSVSPISPTLNCLYTPDLTPNPSIFFGVVAGASKVLLYTTPGTPLSATGLVTLTYSVIDLGLVGVTARQTVTIAPQGGSMCALNDPALNPCAPLPTL